MQTDVALAFIAAFDGAPCRRGIVYLLRRAGARTVAPHDGIGQPAAADKDDIALTGGVHHHIATHIRGVVHRQGRRIVAVVVVEEAVLQITGLAVQAAIGGGVVHDAAPDNRIPDAIDHSVVSHPVVVPLRGVAAMDEVAVVEAVFAGVEGGTDV